MRLTCRFTLLLFYIVRIATLMTPKKKPGRKPEVSSAPFQSTSQTQSTSSAPKVLLSSHQNIFKLDAGLSSIAGALQIISMIRERRRVASLVLGHNDLGDDGCKELFRFLSSEDGQKYQIQEISLNANHITDKGLEYMAEFLDGNRHLKQLFLQNNLFQGAAQTVKQFVKALNNSSVEVLSFVTNCQLGDAFLTRFLADLRSPALRELQVSALGLSAECTPAVVEYLSSPRSGPLEVLKCNGNYLGLRSVWNIVRTIQETNFSLMKFEVYSSHLSDVPVPLGGASDDEAPEEVITWDAVEKDLKHILLRNELLKRRTQESAVAVLPYARTLLLKSRKKPDSGAAETSSLQTLTDTLDATTLTPVFQGLPPELVYHILSFLAPALSSSQLTRIYKYAENPSTLPKTALKQHACVPDPSAFSLGAMKRKGCGEGRCLGQGNSLVCSRIENRNRYLTKVGCTHFELDAAGRNRGALDGQG